jgi:hypothetical protein
MIDERELSRALHDLAARDDTAAAPPIPDLIQRGRRARSGRVAVVAAVTVTTGALVATAVAVAPRGSQQVAGAPVPLALAAQTTEHTTFRFTVTGVRVEHGTPWQRSTTTGAYDPTGRRGYFTYEDYQGRQVGTECFYRITSPPHVSASDSPAANAPPPGAWQRAWTCADFDATPRPFVRGFPDPVTLVNRIAAGTVTYAGRTGGTHPVDTYRYSYDQDLPRPPHGPDPGITEHATGVVEIDAVSHRIIRITDDITSDSSPASGVKVLDSEYQVELVLSDFGTRVDVSVPTNPLPPDPTASPAPTH